MKRLVCLALLLGICVLWVPVHAGEKDPMACGVLTEKDALALVGGPLGEVFQTEEKPEAFNGYDHISVCGFFPKGYNIQEASLPPERGVQLQLHVMRDKTDAKGFYDNTFESAQSMINMPGSPLSGAKITPLAGMSDAAFLQSDKSEPEPKSIYHITTVTFLKGNIMGQLQVWKKAKPVDDIAKTAAKTTISRLP
jgi:hypothetical protein